MSDETKDHRDNSQPDGGEDRCDTEKPDHRQYQRGYAEPVSGRRRRLWARFPEAIGRGLVFS